MKTILEFLKSTIIGGLLFLLPIAATALIFFKAWKMAMEVASPVAEKLPLPRGEAVLLLYIFAITAFILLAFISGVILRAMPYERKFMPFLEDKVLRKFPPYATAKKYTNLIAGLEVGDGMKPALIRVGDAWQLGFVIESINDDTVVTFVPSAPDPSSGDIYMVHADHISYLNVPKSQAVECIENSGRGLARLLAKSQGVE